MKTLKKIFFVAFLFSAVQLHAQTDKVTTARIVGALFVRVFRCCAEHASCQSQKHFRLHTLLICKLHVASHTPT